MCWSFLKPRKRTINVNQMDQKHLCQKWDTKHLNLTFFYGITHFHLLWAFFWWISPIGGVYFDSFWQGCSWWLLCSPQGSHNRGNHCQNVYYYSGLEKLKGTPCGDLGILRPLACYPFYGWSSPFWINSSIIHLRNILYLSNRF